MSLVGLVVFQWYNITGDTSDVIISVSLNTGILLFKNYLS